ncbi:MAG TPA: pitrilysin family protein [Vicinamibacterales bacterium]|nr:pitrilysin family protein [Vicinamibacterales bacterium]
MTPADRSRLPGLGPDPVLRFPAIEKSALSNGVKVWTIEHRDVPIVVFVLLLPVGAAADPDERPGLAAITGDMLDEGCGSRSALDVHDALARIGAQFETEVGSDATVLTMSVLARNMSRGVGLLAEMTRAPRFEQKEFDRVRDLRLNRLLQLRDLAPAVADRAFTQLLYRNHPYGHLAIGSEGSLRGMMLREVTTFYRHAYRPERMTLIAVGDATHAALREAIARGFEDWSFADGVSPHVDPGEIDPPTLSHERVAIVHRAGAAQSELRIGQVAAARRSPDYHALLVLNMVLGGQFVSRVNMNLREDKGYTYGARTAFDFRRGRGPFVLQVGVQTDVTADALREALFEVAAIRGDRPVTEAELTTARAALTRGYPRNFETADQIARAAAQLALYDLPDNSFTEFAPRVAAVTEADATRVAQTYLDLPRMLTVVVGDRDRITAPLAALNLGASSEVAMA